MGKKKLSVSSYSVYGQHAASARRNPIGIPAALPDKEPVKLVYVGPKGKFAHIYDPEHIIRQGNEIVTKGAVLCGSGYRSSNGSTTDRNLPELYPAKNANYVTCSRCIRLGTMNYGKYGGLLPRRQ